MTTERESTHQQANAAVAGTGSHPQSVANSIQSDNIRVVEDMLYGLQDRKLDTVESLLADDVVYQNVGYHPAVRGREKVMKIMSSPVGFGVRIDRALADATTVLTERTDAMYVGPLHIQFWAVGVFEVHDGQITVWRDYIDLLAMLKGLGRAVVALAIPALRPTL